MLKTILLTIGCCATLAGPALAEENTEYPAPTPYSFHRSVLTRRAVIIRPYCRPFPIRVYTTPQQQPFYNVPPYAVISPY